MHYDLLKLKTEMDMNKYSLKDLALYFEKFDGYVCKIDTNQRTIKFLIDVNCLPHMVGVQHAFKGKKDKNEYKGLSGFEKMKNGEITYNDIMKGIKNNNESNISWKNIKNRIKFLPMFLNSITNDKSKLKIRDDELICRKIYMNGDFFLYKSLPKNNFPILSLKNIGNGRIVIETFIVDNDITLLGALPEEKIESIELISPLEITSPISIIKHEEKDATPVG